MAQKTKSEQIFFPFVIHQSNYVSENIIRMKHSRKNWIQTAQSDF